MQSNIPSAKNFALVPQISGHQRSIFNRSHGHKSTFDIDELIPFYIDEILPGDTQDVSATLFARLSSPMDFPIMDNLHIDTFYFFCPNRILWENWEKFQGAQDDPTDSIVFTTPKYDDTTFNPGVGSMEDYFGIPPRGGVPPVGTHISSLHARAYNLIFNEWFRDENLQDSAVFTKDDGPDTSNDYNIRKRNKSHDYFTSCLPWTQKGTAPTVSLGTSAPVIGNGEAIELIDTYPSVNSTRAPFGLNGSDVFITDKGVNNADVGDAIQVSNGLDTLVAFGLVEEPDRSGMIADLSSATGFTINDLRETVTIQQLLELDARGGTRYTEILKSHWGVTVPDFRLQRPEYLGGSTQMMNVNSNTQTTADPASPTLKDSAGAQSAYVTGLSKSGYSKSFVEHGVIIGIVNVRADVTYQQGLNRMFSRKTRYDYYMPVFANIGEQAVLNQEIWFHNATLILDEGVFGYQEAWAEYRHAPSRISGKFRSDASGTLDAWHLSEDFGTLPALNNTFIQANSETALDRTLAVTTEPNIIFDSWIKIKHGREMPVYSIPGLKRL